MAKTFTVAARKRAILRALEQTGNLTLAAEKARVTREWIRRHRKLDPSFNSGCLAAVEQAKLWLADADGAAPPSGWGTLDGAELVVHKSSGRRVQIRRAKLRQWSPSLERRFLAALASSCNVQAACAEVGMAVSSAYRHRKTWVAFARAWDEAVETGYRHLESELVLAGRNLFSDEAPAVPSPITEMTAAQALHLLNVHKHHVHGVGKGPREKLVSPLPEATARLEQVMRRMGLIGRDDRDGDGAPEEAARPG
jgi:hypothetical protein